MAEPRSVAPAAARWLWVAAAIGAALRIVPYLHNRALWYDEAATTLAIGNAGPASALPMPAGFVWTVRRLTELLGTNEYALRLFPLVCGLAAMALFVKVAAGYLEPAAAILSVVLFATSDQLIYYSSEVKQYSGDAAIALLLFLVSARIAGSGITAAWALTYAGVGAAAIWFSQAAVFVLAGGGTILLARAAWRRRWTEFMCVAGCAAVWLISFVPSYELARATVGMEGLRYFWTFAFPPLPTTASAAIWYPDTFINVFRDPAGFVLPGLAAFAFLVGAVSLARERPIDAALALAPVPFALAAAAFRLYPFADRLLLFLVPAALLMIAHGALQLVTARPKIVAVALIALLAGPSAATAAYRLVAPLERQEIKPVLDAIGDGWLEGDRLYVYYGATPAFEYYRSRYGLAHVDWHAGIQSRGRWTGYFSDLDQFRGTRRLWVLFSHVYDWDDANEEKLLLFHLDQLGRRLTSVAARGAAVHLYDLSRADE